jgi:hypothetical protein
MVFSRCVRTGKTTGLSCVPEKHALNNPSSHLLKDGYENCVGVQYNLLGEGDGGASVIVPNQQEGLQLGSGQASSDLQLLLEDWRLQNDAPDGLGDGGHVMFELVSRDGARSVFMLHHGQLQYCVGQLRWLNYCTTA